MGFIDTALAIFFGNILSVCFVWGCFQFHKHDYRASWVAYAAFCFPLMAVLVTLIATGAAPPQFDALVPR